jgi:uncharacterized protein
VTTEIDVPPPASTELTIPPPPPEDPLRPVAPRERVHLIDIVRGLALFGILAANIRGFSGPAITYFAPHLMWPSFPDRLAQAFVDTFIQGKFITIFAFLFGVGFAVQLDRAEGKARFEGTYAKRLLILAGIGVIHGLLIWFGDILVWYALTGLLLIAFRKASNKVVIIVAVIAWMVPVLLTTAAFTAALAGVMPKMPGPKPEEIQRLVAIFTNGSFLEVTVQRAKDALLHNWVFVIVGFAQILGLFLFGLLAWRKRFFHPTAETLPKYRRAALVGLGLGIPMSVGAAYMRWVNHMGPMPRTWPDYGTTLLGAFSTPLLSLGYVCTIILLCQSETWRSLFRGPAAIGRTALTNYLLQSVIGTLLFYGYGFGLFGIGPAWLLLFTVAIYAVQAIISPLWLKYFRYGPVEWLWRRLTYRGPLPMRREEPAALPEPSVS